jgi:hypothetical protein
MIVCLLAGPVVGGGVGGIALLCNMVCRTNSAVLEAQFVCGLFSDDEINIFMSTTFQLLLRGTEELPRSVGFTLVDRDASQFTGFGPHLFSK